jgi:hypothetical protein
VCITCKRNAPIGRKKSIRTSHGDARILFFCFFRGIHSTVRCGLRPADFEELSLGNFQEVGESTESAHVALLAFSAWVRLASPGEAESGSAGVQPDEEYPGRRCAEGASAWRDFSCQAFFVPPSDTARHALKTHRQNNRQRCPFSTILVLRVRPSRSTSSNGQSSKSPRHLSGALPGRPERPMKIVERSEKERAGPFKPGGLCRSRPMHCVGAPPSTRNIASLAHFQDVSIPCVVAQFTPTQSGW